jgi:hypothetical protein
MKDLDYTTILFPDGRTKFLHLAISQIEGMKKLTAMFIKILFTTPGTAFFQGDLGGGIMALTRTKVSSTTQNIVKAQTWDIVQRAIMQLKSSQEYLSIPDSEKLKDARIRKLEFTYPDTMTIEIEFENVNGDLSAISVPIVQRSEA